MKQAATLLLKRPLAQQQNQGQPHTQEMQTTAPAPNLSPPSSPLTSAIRTAHRLLAESRSGKPVTDCCPLPRP